MTTRRAFLADAGASIAALAALNGDVVPAQAALVYTRSDWSYADFQKLLKQRARMRQVYDIRTIGEGMFLNAIKNSLNGFHYGFDVPAGDIKIVAAMHGHANMLNFDDSVWSKYRLGEWLKVMDPKTGKPATRNPFYPKTDAVSTDPNDHKSIFQDTSIQALQSRGVQFLSCHTATEAQAGMLKEQFSLAQDEETIVRDLQAHTLPGVMIVPAMVSAISLLQSEGRFTYIMGA